MIFVIKDAPPELQHGERVEMVIPYGDPPPCARCKATYAGATWCCTVERPGEAGKAGEAWHLCPPCAAVCMLLREERDQREIPGLVLVAERIRQADPVAAICRDVGHDRAALAEGAPCARCGER